MTPYAVKVPVTASVLVECVFCTESDGWKGACEELGIAVRGNNFGEAKKNLETALQTHLQLILRKHKMAA
jgi:hypothetical protein